MVAPEQPRVEVIPDARPVYDRSLFEVTYARLRQGLINTVQQYRYPTGELFVKREAKDFEGVIHRLRTEEYPAVGFVGGNRNVRGMSLPEQGAHMDHAVALGLATVSPVFVDEQVLFMPFIQGEDLRKLLRKGKTRHITLALDSLNDAHKKDFIFGDRWAGNIIIQKDGTPVHIDFDVKVEGENAAELELAQLMYSTLWHTKQPEKAKSILNDFVHTHPEYDWNLVSSFLSKYESYMPPKKPLDASQATIFPASPVPVN